METTDLLRVAARRELAAIGFRERKDKIYTRELDDEAIGWLGLNQATHRDHGAVAINPVVGVRHQAVEKLVAELAGRTLQPFVPPTAAIPLGYLTPHRYYREWLIAGPDEVDRVILEIVEAVARYGIPFIEENRSLKQLLRTLQRPNHGIAQNLAYTMPAGFALLGDHERARESVADSLARFGVGDGTPAKQMRMFAAALESYLSRDNPAR